MPPPHVARPGGAALKIPWPGRSSGRLRCPPCGLPLRAPRAPLRFFFGKRLRLPWIRVVGAAVGGGAGGAGGGGAVAAGARRRAGGGSRGRGGGGGGGRRGGGGGPRGGGRGGGAREPWPREE